MIRLPETCLKDLQELLASIRPQQVLILHPQNDSVPDEFRNLQATVDTDTFSGDKTPALLEHMQVYDVVLLAGFETLPRKSAKQLISRIRDFHAHHFLLLADRKKIKHGGDWSKNDFIALGLRLFRDYKDEGDVIVYRFELSDYKTTPEWLNSRHWANPELYGKYRW